MEEEDFQEAETEDLEVVEEEAMDLEVAEEVLVEEDGDVEAEVKTSTILNKH